jgi:nitroreductase
MPDIAVDLGDVIRKQRACRSFDPTVAVTDAELEVLLDAAVHAPSAENTQPWVFLVVRNDDTRRHLAEIWAAAWATGRDQVRASVDDTLFADLERGMAGGGFGAAPVVIVVAADLERVDPMYAECSIYPAIQNLLLTATSIGLGSCLTTGLTTFFADQVQDLLDLPSTIKPLAAVYLGVPDRPLGPPRRRPAASCTFRERYGAPW